VRKVLLVVAVAACSSHPAERASPSPAGSAARPAPGDSATLITPEVTGVMRGAGADFPVVAYVSSLLSTPPPCWTALRAAIATGIQLEIPGAGTYFVFEGQLPREEVERCVTTSLADTFPVRVTHDGELVAFDAGPRLGTAYAAWRGSSIVAGTRAQVTSALAVDAPDVARTWRERMASLPPASIAMWRSDALITNLFGVPTTSYVITIDHSTRAGQPFIDGRVIARYASADDATEAAGRVTRGELEPALNAPPELVEAFKRMKQTQTGTTVEIGFDLDMFEGVDLGLLQHWLGSLAARPAGP